MESESFGYTFHDILVTGGCGFVGSNLVNHLLRRFPNVRVVNIDKMDYCSSAYNIDEEFRDDSKRYVLIPGSLCDLNLVYNVLTMYKIEVILHLAAQSHVQNSFGNSLQFTQDNIVGTHSLLEAAKRYNASSMGTHNLHLFIYMSTDEVHGDSTLVPEEGGGQIFNPTNPYAATKAACELLVGSYSKSFGLPTIIVRSNNIFGPRQHSEKLIPQFIQRLKAGEKCKIQGSGKQMRTFVYVEDVCDAFVTIIQKGRINEVYEIGSNDEFTVLDIARILIGKLDPEGEGSGSSEFPWGPGHEDGEDCGWEEFVEYIADRDFNDFRYEVNTSKLEALGWSRKHTFDQGLVKTLKFYSNKRVKGHNRA